MFTFYAVVIVLIVLMHRKKKLISKYIWFIQMCNNIETQSILLAKDLDAVFHFYSVLYSQTFSSINVHSGPKK